MNTSRRQKSENGKRRIQRRLAERHWEDQAQPMFSARNITYDVAERVRGIAAGGIGLMHRLARRVGLVDGIDERLHLLKRHLPYHESDHVLNIAYNVLAGGHCLEDLELLRNNEVYMDALGAQRIPDPTTAGDFCRRFTSEDVDALQDVINDCRERVWAQQPREFFAEAIIEADGTLAATAGECKLGMDIAYDGTWGYHPLVVSLANTQEPLFLVNRSGNRPSHEGAAQRFDQAIALCRRAGFRKVFLRGDTDFSQTRHLDRWDDDRVRFLFGIDASKPLQEMAAELPDGAWRTLRRPARYEVATEPRARPENVKRQIVEERGYTNIRTASEMVASFEYRPAACKRAYRIVVLRKNLTVARGEEALLDDIKLFFFITNDRKTPDAELALSANARCNQENLIAQLKSGVKALRMPVDDLVSNSAYMVMTALAWTLKAWLALLLPVKGRWRRRHREESDSLLRMEFRTFLNAFMLVPCQIVRTGRRVIYKLLSWNPWQHVFLRAQAALDRPMRC